MVALFCTAEKAKALETMGATVTLADALNRKEFAAAIKRAEPEVIIHQLTTIALQTPQRPPVARAV